MKSKYESILTDLIQNYSKDQGFMMKLMNKFLQGDIKDVIMECETGHSHQVGTDAMKYLNAAKQGMQITCPNCDKAINNVKLLLRDNSLVNVLEYVKNI